jgi:hypothetical protein
MLAREMLLAVDLIVSGEGLGLEVARDLFREVRHAYPELVDEADPFLADAGNARCRNSAN